MKIIFFRIDPCLLIISGIFLFQISCGVKGKPLVPSELPFIGKGVPNPNNPSGASSKDPNNSSPEPDTDQNNESK